MVKKLDLPVVSFENQQQWERWLSQNHDKSKGIWLRMYKKATGIKTVNYDQALDEALCYGWIDGQVNKYDDKSYIQRFTPRRKRSTWSQRNTEHIARLTQLGKMRPSGIKEVERAKADGRWENAYGSPQNMVMPEDFLEALNSNVKAKEFFSKLNKSNVYAVYYMLNSAKKPETRIRRIAKFIKMFSEEKKLY